MSKPEARGPYSAACIAAFDLIDLTNELKEKIIAAQSSANKSNSFVSVGEVALGDQDIVIPIGVKNKGRQSTVRAAKEMHFGDTLLNHDIQSLSALPAFTLPVQGEKINGSILTEDFTKGGAARVDEIKVSYGTQVKLNQVPEGLHRVVYRALESSVYPAAFGHMIGRIGSSEVLLDFNDVAYPSGEELEEYIKLADKLTLSV